MARYPDWHSMLPFPRPKTPEEILEDVAEALAFDTGLPLDVIKGSGRELTPEEILHWRKVNFGG